MEAATHAPNAIAIVRTATLSQRIRRHHSPDERAANNGTSNSSIFSFEPIAMIDPIAMVMLGAARVAWPRHCLTKNHAPIANNAVPSDAYCSEGPVDRVQISTHIRRDSVNAVIVAPNINP